MCEKRIFVFVIGIDHDFITCTIQIGFNFPQALNIVVGSGFADRMERARVAISLIRDQDYVPETF